MTVVPELPTPRHAGWRGMPAWSVLAPVKRQGHAQELVLSVYREHGVIPKASRDDNHNRTPENLDAYQLVEPGDVVFNKMKAWSGSVGVSRHRGIVSPDYMVCQVLPSDIDGRFLHYLLRSQALFSEYRRRSKGIRPSQWRLYFDDLRSVELPLPGLDTQRRIAEMLDAETARIDTLVEKNQRVLTGLETRWGAQLEHSLAAWAGSDIAVPSSVHKVAQRAPAGWRATRIDSITAAVQDKVTLAEMAATGEVIHYTIEELGDTGEPRIDDGADIGSDKLRVRGDELLFSRLNPRKGHVFEVAVHDELAVASGEFAIMRPVAGTTTRRFLFYYLTTPLIRGALDAGVRSVTKSQQRVSFDRIWRTAVALPPLTEQHRLVNHLDGVRAQLDALGDGIRRQNELLRLRRQALITAAVTGEIEI